MANSLKFLVVDDEAHVRSYLSMLLEDTFDGAAIAVAENGQQALEQYTAEKPDVVLLDINMIGMNGLETLHELRQQDPAANVIMVTSVDVRRAVEQAVIDGAKGYLLKDSPMEELADSLEELVNQIIKPTDA
jgi:DNA-binding NarL/FixJ family response regulator